MKRSSAADIIIRTIKIDLVLDMPNETIAFFNTLWDCLIKIEDDIDDTVGYYLLDSEGVKDLIFYHDVTQPIFYCDYDKFWSIIEDIPISYKHLQEVTYLLVSNKLNGTSLSNTLIIHPMTHQLKALLYDTK